MGSSISVYVGCYLELPIREVEEEKTIYHDLRGRQSTRYDGDTGRENVATVVKETKTVYPDAWIDEKEVDFDYDEDLFWSPEGVTSEARSTFFLLNNNCQFNRFGYFDYHGGGVANLNDVNIKELIEKFSDTYDEYINFYVKKYGQVSIRFGVVSYWS